MNNLVQAQFIGAGIGLAGTALLFFTVDWYHDLLIWSWTNPWLVIPGLAGIAIARMTDRD